MAKITRSTLKGLVKECLVEILAEGLLNESSKSNSSSVLNTLMESKNKKIPKKSIPNRPALDFIKMNAREAETESKLMENARSLAGGDSMMAEIFADTAKNTLMSQQSAERNNGNAVRRSHGDAATKAMVQSDPMDLFEGARKLGTVSILFPKGRVKKI